jgi:hypothetical protein
MWHNAGSFFDRNNPIRGDVAEFVDLPARPINHK